MQETHLVEMMPQVRYLALASPWARLLLLVLLTTGCSQTPLPGEKVTAEIREGERHRYTEPLERGAFLHLRVEQHGVDVTVQITRGAEALHCVDLRIGSEGFEDLWWIAPATASYDLSIFAVNKEGAYTLEVERRSAATESQMLRARAQEVASKAAGHRCEKASASDLAKAAELWRESGNTWQEALAWAEAGRTAVLSEEFANLPEAVDCLSRALELFQQLGQPTLETRVSLRRAQAFSGLGQLRDAFHDLRRAIRLAARYGPPRYEARARNDLAVLQLQIGDYNEALENYRRAAQLWRQLGSGFEAQVLNGLAEIHMRLGEMDKARTHLESAREFDGRFRFRTLWLMGWWHYLKEDAETALDFYREAQQVHGARELERAGLFDRMGSAHLLLKEWDQAELRYKEALAILGRRGASLNLAHTFSNFATLFLFTDQMEAGRAHCDRALEIFHRLGDRDSASHALGIRARLRRKLGDLHGAQKDLAQAVELLEELRRAAGPPASRALFLAGRIDIYRLYVEVLMELHSEQSNRGWDVQALNISERARARSLLDLLSEAEVDTDITDPELIARQRWLMAEIVTLDIQASTRQDPLRRREAERALEERLGEQDRLLQQIRLASQGTGRLTPTRPLVAEEVRELLEEDTLFLAYGFGTEYAYLWWIDGSGTVGSKRLLQVKHLKRWAEEWIRLLANPDRDYDWRQREERARELRNTLLRPAAEAIGRARRLVIVGDGALRSLPFTALPSLADDENHLITTHEIVYLTSASTLALMRERTHRRPLAPEPLFAVGDPVYDLRDGRLDAAVRSTMPGRPNRLKHSGLEVQQILAVADPNCEDCDLLGFDANLATLSAIDLSRYRILHFATHSKIDHQAPRLSAIRLARFDRSGAKQEKHLLRFYSIFRLDLPAELVVLSACSTALGEHLPGEGLINLSRAFNYAGVPRTLMTLWDVQDESTAVLMTRFYEGLFHHRLAPAEALRQAQLAMIAENREPYQWAAFVLQGEWRPFAVLATEDGS